MTERIPKKVLETATLKMCQRIATVMITTMAESNVTYETIEKRLGKRKNWGRKLIDGLITGAGADKEITLRDLAVFMFACDGSMLQFHMERRAIPPTSDVDPTEIRT